MVVLKDIYPLVKNNILQRVKKNDFFHSIEIQITMENYITYKVSHP